MMGKLLLRLEIYPENMHDDVESLSIMIYNKMFLAGIFFSGCLDSIKNESE